MVWVSDREPAERSFFGDVIPEAEVLSPHELEARLKLRQRPDGLVIDGTQLLELPARERAYVLTLPRVLICTGMLLASMPMNLISGPGVAILAKPFCSEDLDAAVEWLRGARRSAGPMPAAFGAAFRRPRSRPLRGRQPAC